MFKKQVHSIDEKQSYLATLTYSKSALQKDHFIVFVNKKGESESNPFIATQLKNTELSTKLSKTHQTGIHGVPDSLFVRGLVSEVENSDLETLLTSGANAVRKTLKLKIQSLSIHFTKSFNTKEIGLFLQGFQLRNYKWEWKSVSEEEKEPAVFKPVREIRVFSETLDEKDAEFVYLQTVVKHVLKARDIGNTRADVATTDFMLGEAQRIQALNKDVMDINWISGKDLE